MLSDLGVPRAGSEPAAHGPRDIWTEAATDQFPDRQFDPFCGPTFLLLPKVRPMSTTLCKHFNDDDKTGPLNYPGVEGDPSRVADNRRVFGAGFVHVETAHRRPHLHSHAVAHKLFQAWKWRNGGLVMEEEDGGW